MVFSVFFSVLRSKPLEALNSVFKSGFLAIEAEQLSFAFSRGLVGDIRLGTHFVLYFLLDQFQSFFGVG